MQADQLTSWCLWAFDIVPYDQLRRTTGDLFFGEIRPFEEVFREGQGMDGQSAEQSGQQGNRTARLAELQKQIISATWKLQREHGGSNRAASKTPGQTSRAVPAAALPNKNPPAVFLPKVIGQLARQDRVAAPLLR